MRGFGYTRQILLCAFDRKTVGFDNFVWCWKFTLVDSKECSRKRWKLIFAYDRHKLLGRWKCCKLLCILLTTMGSSWWDFYFSMILFLHVQNLCYRNVLSVVNFLFYKTVHNQQLNSRPYLMRSYSFRPQICACQKENNIFFWQRSQENSKECVNEATLVSCRFWMGDIRFLLYCQKWNLRVESFGGTKHGFYANWEIF